MSFVDALQDLQAVVENAPGTQRPDVDMAEGNLNPQNQQGEAVGTQSSLSQPEGMELGSVDPEAHPEPGAKAEGEAGGGLGRRKSLSGSTKRRFGYWLKKGFSRQEAGERAARPLLDFPEYREEVAAQQTAGSSKQQSGKNKRPRTSEGSPGGQPSRKAGKFSGPSMAQVAGSVRVGIQDAGRTITPAMACKVEGEIVRLLTIEGEGPQILGFSVREGVIILTCQNAESRTWLADRIGSMKPWEGASLRLLDEKELPKPVIVVAYVPTVEGVGPESILGVLHAQNKEVGCDRWRLINSKADGSGHTYCFGLDATLLAKLQRRNLVLCLAMRTVTFRVKGHRAEGEPVPGPSAAGSGATVEGSSRPPAGAPSSDAQRPSNAPQPTATESAKEASVAWAAVAGSQPTPAQSPARGRGSTRGAPFTPSRGTRGSYRGGGHHAPRGAPRGRGAYARGLITGRPVQLPSLKSEHTSKKAARNPLNNFPPPNQ
ncbi:hypothetical protein O0L34_g7857 [Tuta absoluta]|nr:hypothetical protein O0L34_g7857 [Tuta absoluta]